MIQHKDEIYSRPKRTWFVTEKEKKVIAKTAKVSFGIPLTRCGSWFSVFSVKYYILKILVEW